MRKFLDRITGPLQAYFIASYTTEFGDSVVGYAKISRDKPEHPWDGTKSVTKVSYKAANHKEALDGAELAARARIAAWGDGGHNDTLPFFIGTTPRRR